METKYQRIGREQRERQAAREKRARAAQRKAKQRGYPNGYQGPGYSAEQRTANRIDGYDRDDLPLSADY